MKSITLLLGVILLCALPCQEYAQTITYSQVTAQNPVAFWSFEDNTDLGSDFSTSGTYDLNTVLNATPVATTTGNGIGNYYVSTIQTTQLKLTTNVNSVAQQDAFTVEFIARFPERFLSNYLFLWGKRLSVSMEPGGLTYRYWLDDTPNAPLYRVYQPLFNGQGPENYHYYKDNAWHHFAFVYTYSGSAGSIKTYIDGIEVPDFEILLTTPLNKVTPSNEYLGIQKNQYTSDTDYDEFAVYDVALSKERVYSHYNDFQNGNAYRFDYQGSPVPTRSFTETLDEKEFPKNYPVNNTASLSCTGNGVDPLLTQLKTWPVPRYDFNSNMPLNIPSVGLVQGTVSGGALSDPGDEAVAIFSELADHFHYPMFIGIIDRVTPDDLDDSNSILSKLADFAKNNPQYPRSIVTNQNRVSPDQTPTARFPSDYITKCGSATVQPYAQRTDLADDNYWQNSNGDFLAINGSSTCTNTPGTITAPSQKVFRTTANDRCFELDGITLDYYLDDLRAELGANTDIFYVVENGEIPPHPLSENLRTCLSTIDMDVSNDYNGSGFTSFRHFHTEFKKRVTAAYRDEYAGSSNGVSNFILYNVGGNIGINLWHLEEMIDINLPHSKTGRRYPTPQLYPQKNYWWAQACCGRNGMRDLMIGRKVEIANGNEYFAPFVSPGASDGNPASTFYATETSMLRPGQYLGYLKATSVLGAEFFHTFEYNQCNVNNPQYPGFSGWQYATPSYSQAVMSHEEGLYDNSELLVGDFNDYAINNPDWDLYRFWAGRYADLVVARKGKTGTAYDGQYLFSGTIQNTTSGNWKEVQVLERDVEVDIENNGDPLKFEIRKQGSTYFYDPSNDAFSGEPLFYQLDSWHEYSHPSWWTTDFYFEAELYEDHSGLENTYVRRTEDATSGGAVTDQDFTDYNTYLTYKCSACTTETFWQADGGPLMDFRFETRDASTQGSFTFLIRARKKSSASSATGVTVQLNHNAQAVAIGCINSTSWEWYAVDINPNNLNTLATFSTPDVKKYRLTLFPHSSELEIDKFVLTTQTSSPFSIAEVGSITPNTTACTGPTAGFTVAPTSVCKNTTVSVTDNSANLGPAPFYVYLCDGCTIAGGTLTEPQYSWTTPGTKTITQFVYPFAGLELQSTQQVTVNNCKRAADNNQEVEDLTAQPETAPVLSVYPNPAHASLHLAWNGESGLRMKIRIESLTGQTVINRSSTSGPDQELDISGLAAGTYLIKIDLNGKQWVEKLVKQ